MFILVLKQISFTEVKVNLACHGDPRLGATNAVQKKKKSALLKSDWVSYLPPCVWDGSIIILKNDYVSSYISQKKLQEWFYEIVSVR